MRNSLLLVPLFVLFLNGTGHCQSTHRINWHRLDYGFAFNALGFGIDFQVPHSKFISRNNFAGSVRGYVGESDSPHRLSLELYVTGRRLDWNQLEHDFNEYQYAPEDIIRHTQGYNSFATVAPGYSYVIGKDQVQLDLGFNAGFGGISKSSHQMMGYSNPTLQSPDYFFQVNHGDKFIGPLGPYMSIHSSLFIRFSQRHDLGIVISIQYAMANSMVDAKYTSGPTLSNGSADYDNATSVLYTEYDKIRMLSVSLGFGGLLSRL